MKIRNISAALLSLALSCAASAAGTATGTLSSFFVMSGGQLLAVSAGTNSGQPACSTQNSYAVDSTTAAGKTIAAALQLAFAAGRTVVFHGNGSCTVWSDREDISYIQVQ